MDLAKRGIECKVTAEIEVVPARRKK